MTRRQRTDYLLPDGLFLDPGNEIFHHRQRNVGLQQCHANFPQRLGDIVFGQSSLAADGLDDPGQSLGKVIQHGVPMK